MPGVLGQHRGQLGQLPGAEGGAAQRPGGDDQAELGAAQIHLLQVTWLKSAARQL